MRLEKSKKVNIILSNAVGLWENPCIGPRTVVSPGSGLGLCKQSSNILKFI
jgi:hypothetical protein